MSKAEQRALEKYPANKTVFDKYEKQRYAFICGYIQAEKDLELTWEDIKTIDKLLNQCVDCNNPYQEVLKRFKDLRQSLIIE